MRKSLAGAIAVFLLLTSCGGSSGGLDSCDDVAEAGLGLFQDALDELAAMSVEELVQAGEEGTPAAFTDLEAEGRELTTKAEELGCTDEELTAYLTGNIDRLEAEEGTAAEFVLEFLKADPQFDLFG